MNALRALKNRAFALMWSGQTISRLGDNLYRIALAWWVLEKTGSALAMGTVLVFSQIPMLIFLLIGGVVVDRLPRLRVMFIADILSGLAVTFVAVFSWLDILELWHLYTASLIFGLVEAFFFPAYAAVIPTIASKDELVSANSLNGLSQRVMGIVGPALGAALVALGGTALAFGLDALSFFLSAFLILPVLRSKLERAKRKKEPRSSLIANVQRGFVDLREGFRYVLTVPWIWISILLFGFINVTDGGPRGVALPFLVSDDLGAGVDLLGWFGSVQSLGFVVGMLFLGQFTRLRHRGLLGYLSVILQGAMFLPLAFKLPIPILFASMFAYGVFFSVFGLIWPTTVQELVPDRLLGRVFSIDALGSFVLLPVGFALAGLLTDLLGAPTVFLIGGLGTMTLTAIGLLHPSIRKLD
jgi:MFS family permease